MDKVHKPSDSECIHRLQNLLEYVLLVKYFFFSTERPSLVGEAIANFLRIEGAMWWAWRIPTAVFSIFEIGAANFLSSNNISSTQEAGPCSSKLRPWSF
jgi:hypothetical protein